MRTLLVLAVLLGAFASVSASYSNGQCPAFIESRTFSDLLFSDPGNGCFKNTGCLTYCEQLTTGSVQTGYNTYRESAITTSTDTLCDSDSKLPTAEGDTFTSFQCFAQNSKPGELGSNVASFCYTCTRKSRNVFCSSHGIQPVRKAFYDLTGVCTCDYNYYNYNPDSTQCNKQVRQDYCNGHGGPPTTSTRYGAKATPVCVCDISWAGTRCDIFVGCPCGTGGTCVTGSRECTCKAGYGASTDKQSCCPMLGGRVCNSNPGQCGPEGDCNCLNGLKAGFDCRPTAASCTTADNCPACLDPTRTEVLGTVDVTTGKCVCYPAIAQSTDNSLTAVTIWGCEKTCPHTMPATVNSVQCAGHGSCLTHLNAPTDTFCTCEDWDISKIGTSQLRVFRLDSATGLCCPAWPETNSIGNVGLPSTYVLCGARGSCSATTGLCAWAAGRADPYGCPIDPGQLVVCNGQTCQQDGTCNCNTGSSKLAGPTCRINVACNPSASLECSAGGTCTAYASARSAILDLGFLKRSSSFGGTTFAHGGILALVRRLYTTFGLYNATDSRLNLVSTYAVFETGCNGMTQDVCLEDVIQRFSTLNAIDKARKSVGNNVTYAARVLQLLHPDITQPPTAWQTAVRLGLGSSPGSASRRVAIANAMSYKRYYDWNSNIVPTYIPSFSAANIFCNCTAPATGALVGFGGLQCQGSCPVGSNGQVCSGFQDGIMNGYCNAADSKCVCMIHRSGPACNTNLLPCINTTIVPYTVCNGRTDAQCFGHAGIACICPTGWTGPFCELSNCPVPTGATYAQLLIECSGFGSCTTISPISTTTKCVCDVTGQLASLDPLATASNRPRLPTGAACEFNAITDCGTFVVTGLGGTGKWSSCNGHGTCLRNAANTANVCACNSGFSGAKCQTQLCTHGGGCNIRQGCNAVTGLCECRPMWTGLARNCTTSLCGHGVPDSTGAACLCEAYWAADPITKRCTVPSCPPSYFDPLLGTQRCTGNEPICQSSTQYTAGGCCRAVCTNCAYNVNISSTPYCICGNSKLQLQTNSICKDRCGGGVPSLINGVLECNCDRVTALLGPNKFIGDPATCSSVVTCVNGGTASGSSCICPANFEGPTCAFAPCGIPGSYYHDANGGCHCNWPFEPPNDSVNGPNWNGVVEGIGNWQALGRPCSSSRCFPQNYFGFGRTYTSQARVVKRPIGGRSILDVYRQYEKALGYLDQYPEIRDMKQSGYACECGQTQMCSSITPEILWEWPPYVNFTIAEWNQLECMGQCYPIDDMQTNDNAYVFDVANNGFSQAINVMEICLSRVLKHRIGGFSPPSGIRPEVWTVTNHTVYCNCSSFDHRAGQFCYDYLCENGGTRVLGPRVNGSCSCEWGTVWDFKQLMNPSNAAPENQYYLNHWPPIEADKLVCMGPSPRGTRPLPIPLATDPFLDGDSSSAFAWESQFPIPPFAAPLCGTGNQRCECPFAYGGKYCQTLLCNPVNATVPANRARCNCLHGWSGPYCSTAPPAGYVDVPASSSTGAAAAGSSSSTASSPSSSSTGPVPSGAGTETQSGAIVALAAVGVVVVGGAALIATGTISTVSAVLASATAAGAAGAGAGAGVAAGAGAAGTAAGSSASASAAAAAAAIV